MVAAYLLWEARVVNTAAMCKIRGMGMNDIHRGKVREMAYRVN